MANWRIRMIITS